MLAAAHVDFAVKHSTFLQGQYGGGDVPCDLSGSFYMQLRTGDQVPLGVTADLNRSGFKVPLYCGRLLDIKIAFELHIAGVTSENLNIVSAGYRSVDV